MLDTADYPYPTRHRKLRDHADQEFIFLKDLDHETGINDLFDIYVDRLE